MYARVAVNSVRSDPPSLSSGLNTLCLLWSVAGAASPRRRAPCWHLRRVQPSASVLHLQSKVTPVVLPPMRFEGSQKHRGSSAVEKPLPSCWREVGLGVEPPWGRMDPRGLETQLTRAGRCPLFCPIGISSLCVPPTRGAIQTGGHSPAGRPLRSLT